MPIPVPKIDQFTEEEGELVRHLVGVKCWCHGPDGQPDPNCTEHENGGWLYIDEQQITGLVTGITAHRNLMETGVFNPGDCVFSPTSDVTVSEGDKIIFTWPLPAGQGDPVVRGLADYDTLYYEAVGGIVCIGEDGSRYRQDIDYRLEGKRIVWNWAGKTGGTRPRLGLRYTIKYTAYIEWIAFVPPVTRISAGEDMGTKVMLRKKHLVG